LRQRSTGGKQKPMNEVSFGESAEISNEFIEFGQGREFQVFKGRVSSQEADRHYSTKTGRLWDGDFLLSYDYKLFA
jgi:hypothetical protein